MNRRLIVWFAVTIFFVGGLPAFALSVNGYSAEKNNRFSSGFPTSPVENASTAFIGASYDWSSVGYSTTTYGTSNPQNLTLIDSEHFVYAVHYSPTVGSTVTFVGTDGAFYSATVLSISGAFITGNGTDQLSSDLGVGTLSTPVAVSSSSVTSSKILFLGYSDANYSASSISSLLVYGKNGVIGVNSVTAVKTNKQFLNSSSGTYTKLGTTLEMDADYTTENQATFQGGDSGGPTFATVNGSDKMYLVGVHWAVSAGTASSANYDSLVSMQLNHITAYTSQSGLLPSVYTPITTTWTGLVSGSGSWANGSNWTNGISNDVIASDKVTKCVSVGFNGTTTSVRSITVFGTRTVTGITFQSATGSNGFLLQSSTQGGTLTIGEAGITNEDDDLQTIACSVILRASQRWNMGMGGLNVSGAINTSGTSGAAYLLLVDGSGTAKLTGVISGSGGLSMYGNGLLYVSGVNTYTGTTWVRYGTLRLGNASALGSSSAGVYVLDGGTLDLFGYTIADVIHVAAGSHLVNSASSLSVTGSSVFSLVGTFALTSSLAWSSGATMTLNSGTLTLAPTASAVISVAGTSASITVSGSSTLVLDATYNDPLTSDSNSNLHVSVVNNSTVKIAGGTVTTNSITGTGSLYVSSTATIVVGTLVQDSLVLGGSYSSDSSLAASSVTAVSAIASSSNAASAGIAGSVSEVPEPSTFACFAIGAGVLAWITAKSRKR